MSEISGGCRCGNARYTISAAPVFTGVCHCRNCQKETGSAFAVVLGVPAAAVAITGELTTFTSTGDSGKTTRRRFCPACGSTIAIEADIMPGLMMVGAGTLDDTSTVQPAMQIYCDSAQPWVSLGGQMQRFAGMPG